MTKEVPMKQINGYENYFITIDGRIWNNRKKKFLKAHFDGKYKMIGLYHNHIRTQYRIHRLVAEYFIPNTNAYPIVRHINEIKTDNNVSNLEWVDLQIPYKHEAIEIIKFLKNNEINFINNTDTPEFLYNTYLQSKQ